MQLKKLILKGLKPQIHLCSWFISWDLFGSTFNDAPVENWTGNISKSIFKYMVLHRKRQIATEVLMDTFWPEAEPESARRNLYQAIYQVRQAFQPNDLDIPIILSSNGSYGINSGISIWLDYEEFIRQYENGRQHVTTEAISRRERPLMKQQTACMMVIFWLKNYMKIGRSKSGRISAGHTWQYWKN